MSDPHHVLLPCWAAAALLGVTRRGRPNVATAGRRGYNNGLLYCLRESVRLARLDPETGQYWPTVFAGRSNVCIRRR